MAIQKLLSDLDIMNKLRKYTMCYFAIRALKTYGNHTLILNKEIIWSGLIFHHKRMTSEVFAFPDDILNPFFFLAMKFHIFHKNSLYYKRLIPY